MRRLTTIVCVDLGEPLTKHATEIGDALNLRSVRGLEIRLWCICHDEHIDDKGAACRAFSDLNFHLSWVQQVVARMRNPRVFVLLSLAIGYPEVCDKACLEQCRRFAEIEGVRELLVREGDPKYAYDEGETKPRVIFKYDGQTKTLRTIGGDGEVGKSPKRADEFGYAEEDDRIAPEDAFC